MSPSFIGLAIELQLMIMSYITRPTDLKVLCLVCKHLSTIATPALYCTVDLRPREINTRGSQLGLQEEQLARLKSLILGKQNLGHTQILMISEYDWYMGNILDTSLMPKLEDSCFIEFYYEGNNISSAYGNYATLFGNFPDTRQMELLWSRQQNIQTFHSTHICTMLRFMRKNPHRAKAILKSVNELILIQKHKRGERPDLITWPLENIAMSSLRKLTIIGWDWAQNLGKMNSLFSNHAFTNLTHIRFKGVIFDTKIELKQCPSLRQLDVICCGSLPMGTAKLSIPTKLSLKSFYFACDEYVDQLELLAPILSQIQELFTLTLDLVSPYHIDKEKLSKCRRGIASALVMQQETLVELVVRENTNLTRPLLFSGKELFAVILGCHTLRRLALPLAFENPIPSYSRLMRDLPRLGYFWLTDCRKYVGNGIDEEFANELMEGMPASSILKFLAFNNFCLTRREPSTQPGLEAEFIMTEMDWKDANPLFFNRYPYSLVLPSKFSV